VTSADRERGAAAPRGDPPPGALRRWAGQLEEALCSLLLVVLVITTSLQVFTRYVLNAPLSWTEELARMLFIWITFLGAAVIAKRGGHVSIDFLALLLPPGARRWMQAAAHAVSLTILVTLGVKGVLLLRITGISASPALGIPWAYVYAAFPLGMFLMAGRYALALLRLLRRPDAPGAEMGPTAQVAP
jgi:TRAP-type transport system small permease protein